jgi:tetratricopeptide (TPR) repeat protein
MSDQRPVTFWVYLLIFQIAFGLTVFGVTREYYAGDSETNSIPAASASRTTTVAAEPASTFTPEMIDTLVTLQPDMTNPVEISRLADQYFANKQYDKAAEWYKKLLEFGPDNVDTLNNLGLTLHYLGRPEEALVRLNQGAMIDPTHQRVWLTLGFVNSDMGDVEAARTALSTAVRINPDNSVGQSASGMLARLP